MVLRAAHKVMTISFFVASPSSRAASSTLNPLVLVTRNSSSINHRALYQPMHANACSAVLMSCEVSRRHSTGVQSGAHFPGFP